MKGRIITDIGQVSVDTDVIAKYAGMAAVATLWCCRYGDDQCEGRTG